MTLQELNRNIQVQEELQRDYELLESLRAKASASTPNLDGMPHGSGVSDKVATLAVAIADVEAEINALVAESKRITESITAYVNTVQNMRVRTAMRLRFVSCLPWKEVADLMGRYYTEDSAQKMVYTYLRRQEENAEDYGQCSFL